MMKKSNYLKRNKITRNFPKMIWLGDQSLYDKAIFIKDYNEFLYLIDELSYILTKNARTA